MSRSGCLTQARETKLLTAPELPASSKYHQVTTQRSSDFSAQLSPPLDKVFSLPCRCRLPPPAPRASSPSEPSPQGQGRGLRACR